MSSNGGGGGFAFAPGFGRWRAGLAPSPVISGLASCRTCKTVRRSGGARAGLATRFAAAEAQPAAVHLRGARHSDVVANLKRNGNTSEVWTHADTNPTKSVRPPSIVFAVATVADSEGSQPGFTGAAVGRGFFFGASGEIIR